MEPPKTGKFLEFLVQTSEASRRFLRIREALQCTDGCVFGASPSPETLKS